MKHPSRSSAPDPRPIRRREATAPGSSNDLPEVDVPMLEATLDYIRPALQADGGDLVLLGVEEGVVTLQMVGACGALSHVDDDAQGRYRAHTDRSGTRRARGHRHLTSLTTGPRINRTSL